MEKIDYKAIVDAAIGEKPSLAGRWIEDKQTGLKMLVTERMWFSDYPTTKENFEYKQETYQEFLNTNNNKDEKNT